MREHRLYQADWLMRFYDFSPTEVQSAADPATGNFALDIDPKLAWALGNRANFPVDVNKAPRETLLRVPGLGVKAVNAILRSRRARTLRLEDIGRLTRSIEKLRPFLIAADWRPTALADRANLRPLVAPITAPQLELFG
jgi:predicted DNA-binding helix-hairpin-helix protein